MAAFTAVALAWVALVVGGAAAQPRPATYSSDGRWLIAADLDNAAAR